MDLSLKDHSLDRSCSCRRASNSSAVSSMLQCSFLTTPSPNVRVIYVIYCFNIRIMK